MARKKATELLSPEELEAVELGFPQAESVSDYVFAGAKDLESGGDLGPIRPLMSSPEWSNFVHGQLSDDESDAEGHPYVFGLRRVARLLIGPIVKSIARVVQSPTLIPGTRNFQPAVVEHTIIIKNLNLGRDYDTDTVWDEEFCEVASVHFVVVNDDILANCDPEFARFSVATASTRAEARALRKLLLLKSVSSEEKCLVPLEDGVDGKSTSAQKNLLNAMSRQLKIDPMKYVNLGSESYKSLDEISLSSCDKMIEYLHKYRNDQTLIPQGIKL